MTNILFDALIDYLLSHQYTKFLEKSKTFTNLWFASHMSDILILFNTNCESQHNPTLSNFQELSIRDDMLIEFASMLISTTGSEWQVCII